MSSGLEASSGILSTAEQRIPYGRASVGASEERS